MNTHMNIRSVYSRLRSSCNIVSRDSVLGGIACLAGCLLATPAAAATVTPIATGELPSGNFIVMTQLTLNPGEHIGWHFHPGLGLRVVLSGALTEDEGCGNPLVTHAAGSAFEEIPGHVHQIFNLGSDPVVVLRTDILPACYVHQGTIFVAGPTCEGESGRAHLEPVSDCSSDD
jgi:quercetin dioxygenase-like cupin family protein